VIGIHTWLIRYFQNPNLMICKFSARSSCFKLKIQLVVFIFEFQHANRIIIMAERFWILNQFSYDLPKDRIAKYPLNDRSSSKLLFYNKGAISHHQYKTLDELIPAGSLMMFNDTKVIPARIIVFKPTGARIEIFLLEPIAPSGSHEEVMNAKGVCEWQCMIGNAKKMVHAHYH